LFRLFFVFFSSFLCRCLCHTGPLTW
jgi:hypothetical protein